MIRTGISIVLSLQLLLAGVPWSVRTHWCGGQVAERTLFGGAPGCGMEEGELSCANEEPAFTAIPCCANDVFQLDAVPSFVKVAQEFVNVPDAPAHDLVGSTVLRSNEVDAAFTHPPHPPDIALTGRDILVRAQHFLI
jgi:hypothetical protein